MITLAEIDNAEYAAHKIRRELQLIGRELYEMREGLELCSRFEFQDYQRTTFSGTHFSDTDDVEWELETPIFALIFYDRRTEDKISVTFPQNWIESDWRALEQERLDLEAAVLVEQRNAEAKQLEARQEAAERETYERLKAKYEGASPKA